MPFHLRKSISAGPFRFNFSRGGVGVSVGVRGLRIGTGPRGHFVHAGIGGLYYRASIPRDRQHSVPDGSLRDVRHDVLPPSSPGTGVGVDMVEVDSGDVLEMRDEKHSDLLAELNETAGRTSIAVLALLAFGLVGLLALALSTPIGVALMVGAVPAAGVGMWVDGYRRRVVLFYELDSEMTDRFQALVASVDGLAASQGKWHIAAGGLVTDLTTWKRNAGASRIVDKKPTRISYALPKALACNITPPSIGVGTQTLYFMPDTLLIFDGRRFGAIAYRDLQMQWGDSVFIEEGNVPSDAIVVGHTWKHPNKGGGPDRRFKTNYQIPLCRYEVLHLTSPSGLNELLEFSRGGGSVTLAGAVRSLAATLPVGSTIHSIR